MDTKTEVGRENIYFEMESKQEDHAERCDDLVFRNDTPQAKPKVETQLCKDSDTVKHHLLFLIVSAIAVASLLTALASHFGFSCDNHYGTERSFYRYGYHCFSLL